MVDPNPARGMPLQLQRYWLTGKGATKIRWNVTGATPGDFKRCVRALRKYFPKDPEGLCNILHQKATGGPPGHGRMEQAATPESLVAASSLLAAQTVLGPLWAGPLAPIGMPTGEPRRVRIFEPGAIAHRPLPLPLSYRPRSGPGHDGSMVTSRILGFAIGPDHEGRDHAWGWGDWLDEEMVPEVKQAKYMVDQGLFGASLDPGGPVRGTQNPETGAEHMTQYVAGGATLVSIAAFPAMRLYNLIGEDGDWPDDDEDMVMMEDEHGCGCGDKGKEIAKSVVIDMAPRGAMSAEFAINPDGWRGLPLAARQAVFDNDDAVKRIAAWAGVNAKGADVAKLHRAFLWRDPQGSPTDPRSYRLPVGDIHNGQLTLVYHAIYAAAALISGAHGGLPGIPDEDKNRLRNVITDIYQAMAKGFNDESIRAPWDRPEDQNQEAAMDEFAADKPYGDVPYADPGYQEDGKARYPLDTEKHVQAAWRYINQEKNAGFYSPKQLMAIRKKILAAMKRLGITPSESASGEEMSIDDAHVADLLAPPAAWFADPALAGKTPLTVTPEGRVYGHLAAWGECHRDVSQRECVLAPRSRMEYKPFHLGEVLTAEGESVRVGKIIMDTRHADISLGYLSAAIHYDNTGDEIAVVRAGEDQYGIWVHGAVVPEATPRQVAKLRRSPLSGDWRAVDGNLELTAALAVTGPAFPVFAMEGEERLALVAAGQLPPAEIDLEALTASAAARKSGEEDAEERAWRLRALLEREEDFEQQQRAQRLALLAAASGPTLDSPDVNGTAAIKRQMDARFQVS